MPKLKVPSTPKSAKKQMSLLQFQRRALHTPSPEKAGVSPADKSSPLLVQFSGSPRKQNGLKHFFKGFYDKFGDSEDEGGYEFDGFFSEAVKKEYNAMLELYFADLPERPVKLEVVQKPTRPRRNKGKGKARWSAADSEHEEDSEETPPHSPVLVGDGDRERREGTVTPDDDNASDSSWEEATAKSARKSSRPKIAPRQHYVGDDPGPIRKRGVRCMECPACMRKDDCAKCEFCRDKKKFGGPGIKKQACIHRKCHNLIRDLPLKVKPKRSFIPTAGSSPPPPKRLHSEFTVEPRPLHASPLKSKRFTLTPASRGSKDKPDSLVVQIHWPICGQDKESDGDGVPVYSLRSHSGRPSLCRKCGSAGKLKMVRCMVCCQIFHTFCTEGGGTPTNPTSLFTCLSCITCQICYKGDKCVKCSQCSNWFHKSCLSCHDSHVSEGTWKCVQCSKCLSCKKTIPGPTSDSLWYDDFKYCSECYQLKQKGNFCPMCGECYSDNDFDSKMVQCGTCDCWVHSHCEGMSDDWYEVLSVLPEESVEFLCRLCGSEEQRKAWQGQVEQYLQDSMTKLLSCIPKATKLSSKLQAIREQVEKREFPSVAGFHEDVKTHFEHVLKKNKPNSALHRGALTEQVLYLNELDELFPWLGEEEEEEEEEKGGGATVEKGRGSGDRNVLKAVGKHVAKDDGSVLGSVGVVKTVVATSAPVQTEWPSMLAHDHCYTASPRPQQPVATKDEEILPKPINSRTKNGANPPSSPTSPLGKTSSSRTLRSGGRKGSTNSPPRSGSAAPHSTGGHEFEGGGDQRRCVLCPVEGDAASEEAGRLVPCGVDEWVHVNCAVWSAEVYEEHNGILRCVHTAISRGLRMRCDLCKEPGATVGCCTSTCSANYHFQCARRSNCLFLYNKQVFCSSHREHGEGEVALPEGEVAVTRGIFVDTHPDRPGRKIPRTLEVSKAAIQIGSIQVHCLGALVELSETTILLPDKFRSSCEFWDTSSPTSTTTYTLTISAPEDDDWLMAPPQTPPHSPSSRPQSPSSDDIEYESITVGEPLPVLWESLKSPPPCKRRKAAVSKKPRSKNIDLAASVASLVSLVRPGVGKGGVSAGNNLVTSSVTDNHMSLGAVDIEVINNFHLPKNSQSQSIVSLLKQATPPATTDSPIPSSSSANSVAHEVNNSLLPDGKTGNLAAPVSASTGPVTSTPGESGGDVAVEMEVECVAESASEVAITPMEVTAEGLSTVQVGRMNTIRTEELNTTQAGGPNAILAGGLTTEGPNTVGLIATQGGCNSLPSMAEDDILKNAMSATLLATSSGNNSGSANIISALTSTDFPNLVWTNSDLSLVDGVGEEATGKGKEAVSNGVKEMDTGLVGVAGTTSPAPGGVGVASMETCSSTTTMVSSTSSISTSSIRTSSGVGNSTGIGKGVTRNGAVDSLATALPPFPVAWEETSSVPTAQRTMSSVPGAETTTPAAGGSSSAAEAKGAIPAPGGTVGPSTTSLAHLINSASNSGNSPILPAPPILNSLPPSSDCLTLVSINSKLYLCTLGSTNAATTIQPLSSATTAGLSDFVPNSSAAKNSKVPKKTTPPSKGRPPAARGRGALTEVPSDGAVAGSICLKRKRHGLPTTPHALSFSISTTAGCKWESHDLKEAWASVLWELQEQRSKLDLPFVPHSADGCYQQFGLTHPLVVQLLEQLPHANRCSGYEFSYHKPSEMTSWRAHRPLRNLSGCSRTEKFNGKRSPRDMFSFLMSDLRPVRPNLDLMSLEYAVVSADSTTGAKIQTASDLPMAMRYRSLQKTYKQHVGVFQSDIHGLGLYCTRDIDPGEMVIEYAGTVIRSVLTDKREKLYDSKGIGCYMFRIDADEVVDATMSGNEARFINHACEPNCYSKVITVDGNKKIMIFALRRIVPGEELTYDYKFPKEEAKIPCNCGSKRCRKTMN